MGVEPLGVSHAWRRSKPACRAASDTLPLSPELAAAHFAAHVHGLLATDQRWAAAQPPLPPPEYLPLALSDAVDIMLAKANEDSLQRAFGTAYVAYAFRNAALSGARTEALPALSSAYQRLMAGLDHVPRNVAPDRVYLALLEELANRAACVKNFELQATYYVPLQSTEVTVTMNANRVIADYDAIMDPQNWARTAPELFLEAFQMLDNGSPSDPNARPTPLQPPAAPPWSKHVFEHAQWSINGTAFSNFRNVLFISYQNGVGSKYELHENLTQNVLGFSDEGGLDADSGVVELTAISKSETRSTTRKKLRFTKPIELKDYLNWLNVPLISMMLLRSVVGNACIPTAVGGGR
jgi:hypothetical protein